jgi:CspA family cold shock protein
MNDRFLVCADCGTRFVHTIAEQQHSDEGPTQCPACRYLAPTAGRQRGLVKFFNVRKGWGFIVQEDGQEIFLHRSGISPDARQPPLVEGDLVEYTTEKTERGVQAINLIRLAAADSS